MLEDAHQIAFYSCTYPIQYKSLIARVEVHHALRYQRRAHALKQYGARSSLIRGRLDLHLTSRTISPSTVSAPVLAIPQTII